MGVLLLLLQASLATVVIPIGTGALVPIPVQYLQNLLLKEVFFLGCQHDLFLGPLPLFSVLILFLVDDGRQSSCDVVALWRVLGSDFVLVCHYSFLALLLITLQRLEPGGNLSTSSNYLDRRLVLFSWRYSERLELVV